MLRAGGRSCAFGWWCDGVLILLTQRVNGGVIVRGCGSTVLGCRLVANGLHSRTEERRSGFFFSKSYIKYYIVIIFIFILGLVSLSEQFI